MKRIITILTVVVVGTLVFLIYNRQNKSADSEAVLVVAASSSFIGAWGPGPTLAQEFESEYGVKIQYVDVGDTRLISQKLSEQKSLFKPDVIMGIDSFVLSDLEDQAWRALSLDQVDWSPSLPKNSKSNTLFVPYNWAPLGFIYRKGELEPPTSIYDLGLVKYKKTLSVLDPRTSTPGFIFWYWINAVSEGSGELQGKIEPSFFAISPSWSTGYALFSKKQAKLVFSYVTSVMYHWSQEKDESYQVAKVREPLPYQIEFAAIPESCTSCALAEQFVKKLLSKKWQTHIMELNYMLPVIRGVVNGTRYESLSSFELMDQEHLRKEQIDQLLAKWKAR